MKPAEEIERFVRKMSFRAGDRMTQRLWADAAKAQNESESEQRVRDAKNTGRWMMRYPITKLAAAAAIVTAVVLGWNVMGGPDMATVALADVAKRIEQTKNCVFKKTTTASTEGGVKNAFDSLVYYAENVVREDVRDDGKTISQVYVKFPDGVLVAVDHKSRTYRRIALAEEDIEKLSPVSPRNLVDLILSKGEYKKLGRETVDGVLSEGFEFDDERAMLSMDKDRIESIVTRLWVDVSTHLPVRVELDCTLTDNARARVAMYDPQWDVELEPDFFEPKIPAGYVEPEQRGLIGINLENWPAIKVVPGMAAEKAGVQSGDVVLKINGSSISGITSSSDALTLLSGKVGEKVALTVRRGEQTLDFEIERTPAPK
ncbi:MAG: PDZ domain-containing protein [Solirubrobacterales bacterium]